MPWRDLPRRTPTPRLILDGPPAADRAHAVRRVAQMLFRARRIEGYEQPGRRGPQLQAVEIRLPRLGSPREAHREDWYHIVRSTAGRRKAPSFGPAVRRSRVASHRD